MKLDWCRCVLRSRCRLNLINLNNQYFDNLTGVYVIWRGNDTSNVVSVGRGNLRDELVEKKIDKKVWEYGPDLFVTWAAVPRLSLKGVEAFLCNKLNPQIPHSVSDIDLISVNLP